MPNIYNQSTFLIVKAAYLYYIMDIPQNEIANMLQISITTVSRLLKKAKEEKIIEFVIRDPYVECIYLEESMREAFGLKEVIIAPTVADADIIDGGDPVADAKAAKKLVALEAARYLQRIIRPKDVLGVTWGSTMYEMINCLNPAQKVDATFVTLHGSISACDNELDVRSLVSRMARAFSGKNYYMLAEGLMSSKRAADVIRREKSIKAVFDMFNNINIAVTGIGSFYPAPTSVLSTTAYITQSELQTLQRSGVVGDILLRFFRENGEECETDLAGRTISIGIDQFRNIETKVILVSGHGKLYPTYEALQGGLIDVLITDYQLANEIMSLHNMPEAYGRD